MHSKQVNFFITEVDWPAINDYFKGQGIIFIKNAGNSMDDMYIKDIAHRKNGESDQVYLTRDEFKSEIFIKQLPNGTYYIDIERSAVIEFSRGGFYPNSKKILNRARLYSIFKYYGEVFEFVKGEEFKKFVNTTFKTFKKKFLKKNERSSPFEMSINAIRWANDNEATLSPSGLAIVAK